MNKWVIILVAVTLAIGASSGVVFALTAAGGGNNPEAPNSTESGGGRSRPVSPATMSRYPTSEMDWSSPASTTSTPTSAT